MKVLITGSSGSFGTIISKDLADNKIPVVGLDIRGPAINNIGDNFRFYKCCITDKKQLTIIFNKEKPTHVIHFACTFNRVRDPEKEYEIDVRGSKNVLEISNNTPSVRQLVFSSSALAYGGYHDNPEWLDETHPLRPGKLRYGLNKKEIENIYLTTPIRDNLRVTLIRVCTVVGPKFGKPASVISILLKWSWLPEFCRETRLQFLHTEDFVSLIKFIISDDQISGIYNLAPDTYSVVGDILPDKKYIKLPVSAATGLLALLYNLRVLNLHLEGINNSIYSIVMAPDKLVSRYNYRFKYTSSEAFAQAGIDPNIDKRENLRQE
ncbi:MAG: NAD-dependent epimerase/dehydratase family protein [Bacteroidota bacterium]|nr:NAD-dependent epimerase/dehydratase family protein [Bacteroidota bacterium]